MSPLDLIKDSELKLQIAVLAYIISKYGIIVSLSSKVLRFVFSPETPETVLKWMEVFEKFKKPSKRSKNEISGHNK